MEKPGDIILQVINDLLNTKVSNEVHLRVNENFCSADEFKLLFNQFTKGTYLERASLTVEEYSPFINCSCGFKEKYRGEKGYVKCPECGKFAQISKKPYEVLHPQPTN